jgi:hypothetical protein
VLIWRLRGCANSTRAITIEAKTIGERSTDAAEPKFGGKLNCFGLWLLALSFEI